MTERALLFTDVVDSTRMSERVGDARAAEIWAAHDQRARRLLALHEGREIGRADGLFLMFDRALDAACFAVAYHAAIGDLGLRARAGIHVGPVTLRHNAPEEIARGAESAEVDGLAVSLAARLMSLAAGGQTLLSASARTALGEQVPEGAEIDRHGNYRLKGIEQPVEVYELGIRGLSPFAPPADADKAYRVARTDEGWQPVREIRNNLPAERDAFVGRTAELRRLATHLADGVRLVSVMGPGGMGKTRLVRRYGRLWLGDWPGGVYFCDLSEVVSLDAIHYTVGAALDVSLGREDPSVQLGNAIAGRGRCLVILDNFEQLVAHAPATVGRWVERAPEAAFVVTTRERLHVAGEEIFTVDALPFDEDAINLFATRARAQRADFVIDGDNRSCVAELVRLLDGLPLAIELAAARVRVLSPARILERLRDRFALLSRGGGFATRQATLRAAIDWSWELLAPWERDALAQCAIFDGGFTLEAAERVLDLSSRPEAPPAIDVVQALSDKSLLRMWVPAAQNRYDIDEPYFGMYISIREYAAQKLEAGGGAGFQSAEERHGRYFAGFGAEAAVESLSIEGGDRRRSALALELDNLVTACRRATRRGDARVAAGAYRAIWEVLDSRGPSTLGIALGTEVLATRDLGDAERAAALFVLAGAKRRAGFAEDAGIHYEESLRLFRCCGDAWGEAKARAQLGNLRRAQGRIEEAHAHLDAALTAWRSVGNRAQEGIVLGNLGILHAVDGRLDQACSHFERAIAIHREVGNRTGEGVDTNNLGCACRELGRLDAAKAHFESALQIQRKALNRREEAIVLGNMALLRGSAGDATGETRLQLESAVGLARQVGDRHVEAEFLAELAELLRMQGAIDEALHHCEQALRLSRAIGDARVESRVLELRETIGANR